MLVLACILCTGAEAQKIHLAQTLVNETIQSQCFEDEATARGIGGMWLNKIQRAKGELQISFYRDANSSTIGWTYAYDTHHRLNRKYHDKFSACKTSATIAHELVHTLGFKHFVDIAYATGHAFEACCIE